MPREQPVQLVLLAQQVVREQRVIQVQQAQLVLLEPVQLERREQLVPQVQLEQPVILETLAQQVQPELLVLLAQEQLELQEQRGQLALPAQQEQLVM